MSKMLEQPDVTLETMSIIVRLLCVTDAIHFGQTHVLCARARACYIILHTCIHANTHTHQQELDGDHPPATDGAPSLVPGRPLMRPTPRPSARSAILHTVVATGADPLPAARPPVVPSFPQPWLDGFHAWGQLPSTMLCPQSWPDTFLMRAWLPSMSAALLARARLPSTSPQLPPRLLSSPPHRLLFTTHSPTFIT